MFRAQQEVCMLESTQGSFMSQGQGFNPIHPVTEFRRAGASALIQLVSPEDTSESVGGRIHRGIQYDGNSVGGAIKLVFWMAAAIVLSILIGQLS
jgi:hypothetical protein